MEYITIALAKGRLAELTMDLLEGAGLDISEMKEKSRKLIFTDEKNKFKFILVKASDVPTYVEYGAADIGIAYHRIMEFLDFARVISEDGSVDTEYIRERAELLRGSGAIEDDVFKELDIDKAAGFFRCDLGRRACACAKAGTLRKEKPFTLKTTRGGSEMLVQGVIDCCFEENGGMVLVDYKSSFIRPGREHQAELERIRHEYKVQIELYSEAAFKGTGKQVSEAYLYLFETGEALRM